MGVFGPGPSIIDVGAAAVEGVSRIRDYMDGDDYESLTDEELQRWADDNGFTYRKEGLTTHLEPETDDAEQVVDETEVEMNGGYPIERRMLESGPEILALEAGGNDIRGDSTMTDDSTPELIPTAYDGSHADHEFGELEVDLREEGQRFYEENEGTYSGDDNIEALGAAVLYEESLEGQDPVDMNELGDYILEEGMRSDFIDYKSDLVDQGLYDQMVQDIEDNVDEIEDIKGDLEREQMFWEAYALEAANERDVAVSAINNVHERAANIDLDTSRLEAAQQARSGLVPREQALNQTREEMRQRSQNEFN
jgi:hypothetical protein